MDSNVTAPQVGQQVTAQNPGGLAVTGTYIGPSEIAGFGRVRWFGPWLYDRSREYVGNFSIASMTTADKDA